MYRVIPEYAKLCEWSSSKFLVISDNVFANLIYYSHLFPFVVLLLFGFFILLKNKKSLSARLLCVLALLTSVWLFADLVLWAHENPDYIMFFWSILILFEPIIYAVSLYFIYAFVAKSFPPLKGQILLFCLLLPTIVLLPTTLSIEQFNLSNCDREVIEGPLVYYGYFVELIIAFWIIIYGICASHKNKEEGKQIFLATFAIASFLLVFSSGNIVGSISEDWAIGQYGLFGIPVFIAILSYMIVKFKTFNIKLIGTQALVVALAILIGSMLLVNDPIYSVLIIAITLILVIVLGYFLVRSVKREVVLRESLQVANEGQENLIHVMNHQIKGYLAKARNIFSELETNDFYGPMPEKAAPMIHEGFKSLTDGVQFVQSILMGSSAQSGAIVYNMQPVDFKTIVLETTEKERVKAEEKGLKFELNIGEGSFQVNGDNLQLREAVRNLIDNSIVYTFKGGLEIDLSVVNSKLLLVVKDTGIGISSEDKLRLFTKGGRGRDSMKVNVNSSGYGLAFVKAVMEAHKGCVWAESEGHGMGSKFTMELPVK